MDDPIEAVVAEALARAGIAYTRDPRKTERLDFFIPAMGVYIECKAYHSDRISEQMARVPNIIAIQGLAAAHAFAAMLRPKRSDRDAR